MCGGRPGGAPDVGTGPADWDPPAGVRQGENDFGNVGYDGPDPPSEHRYRFKLYALDTTLDLDDGADRSSLGETTTGSVAAQTQVTGTYGG